jgi:hypothetical protein
MLLLSVLGTPVAVRAESSAEDAPSGVPDLDLAKWNMAYDVTVANVTEGQLRMCRQCSCDHSSRSNHVCMHCQPSLLAAWCALHCS